MVESTSTVSGPSSGLAAAAHALARISPVTLSSWRTCPNVKLRSQVPTVEAAITWCPSTLAVNPQRSSSTSSMQSPPATRAWTSVSSLRPGWAAPGRSPRSTSWSAVCSIPSRSASVAGNSSPAEATARWSSNAISTWSSSTCEDAIEKVSSDSGIVTAWQPSFSLVRGPFSYSPYYTHCTHRWIQAEAPIVRRMKDDFLGGASLRGIARWLNDEGIKPPGVVHAEDARAAGRRAKGPLGDSWYATTVRKVLSQPAIAALVSHNRKLL